MLNQQEFIRQLFDLKDQYRDDNEWVGKWQETWNDPVVMTRFIEAAYNLYRATATNALHLTLLGGTEIRLDKSLVKAFGVTAANGIQDAQTKLWVENAIYSRRHNAQAARVGPNSRNPDRVPAPVTGSGSILSEQRWTPILNDSLILGAITAGQTFALAFTPEEQLDWDKMNGSKVNKTQVLAARFGETPALKNAWKAFLNDHPKMFFDNFGPRVFSRELLGLKWFGYKPEFSWHQLGFFAGTGARQMPSFQTYVDKLRAIHFQSPCDKTRITAEISTFLFNDARALGNPWTK